MTDRWNCKHDWEQEQDDLAKLDAHQDELCEGPGQGLCDYCNAAECDCWDVHANLNLDRHTCGCECHKGETWNKR